MSYDPEPLAREFLSAYETGAMVPILPSARAGFDLEAAYEVEATLKRMREAAGVRALGRKVGYANKAMWRALKLDTLVWAHMYSDTIHYSELSSTALALPHRRSLKVEPEIVFGLKRSIEAESLEAQPFEAQALASAALEATAWLALGFEIIDCPFPGWKFQPSDLVASFGFHAALLIGARVPVPPESIATFAAELPRLKLRLFKNGEFVEEGFGRNSLKSPALCLAELGAAILRRFPSEPLRAGEIVSSGTLTSGHSTDAGDSWTAQVEGLPLPPLTLRLA